MKSMHKRSRMRMGGWLHRDGLGMKCMVVFYVNLFFNLCNKKGSLVGFMSVVVFLRHDILIQNMWASFCKGCLKIPRLNHNVCLMGGSIFGDLYFLAFPR